MLLDHARDKLALLKKVVTYLHCIRSRCCYARSTQDQVSTCGANNWCPGLIQKWKLRVECSESVAGWEGHKMTYIALSPFTFLSEHPKGLGSNDVLLKMQFQHNIGIVAVGLHASTMMIKSSILLALKEINIYNLAHTILDISLHSCLI